MNNRVYVAAPVDDALIAVLLRPLLVAKGYNPIYTWPERAKLYGDHHLEDLQVQGLEDEREVLSCAWFIQIGDPDKKSGGGSHTEFGMARVNKSRLFVIGHRGNIFHFLPQVKWYTDIEDWENRFPPFGEGYGRH